MSAIFQRALSKISCEGASTLIRVRCMRYLPLLVVGISACVALLPAAKAADRRDVKGEVAAPLSEAIVRARADALIAQMTPEEKAAQLSLYFYFQTMPSMTAGDTPRPLYPYAG